VHGVVFPVGEFAEDRRGPGHLLGRLADAAVAEVGDRWIEEWCARCRGWVSR
jgi:hypothetical protein